MPEFAQTFVLSSINGVNGLRINNADGIVAAAGDVNGDGFGDVSLTRSVNRYAEGEFYETQYDSHFVVFGGASLGAAINVDALQSGVTGFEMVNETYLYSSHNWLTDVSATGDINGDGFDDVLTATSPSSGGLHYYVDSAIAKLRLGGAAPQDSSGFGANVIAVTSDNYAGTSLAAISGAGDVNGDGFDDALIGIADPGKSDPANYGSNLASPGTVYLRYGSAAGDLATGTTFTGIGADDHLGSSIAGGGDINGDGFDDLLMRSTGATNGEVFAVFGSVDPAASTDLSALNGTNGLRINGLAANDAIGKSLTMLGDVNADGYEDFGFSTEDASDGNSAYVVFGRASGFGATLDLSAPAADSFIKLTHGVSNRISGAGDVNGDGFADMILGTDVIFGRAAFANEIDVTLVNGNNGFRFSHTRTIQNVSSAGDVNRDGLGDLIASDGTKAFLFYGHVPGFGVTRNGTDIGQTIYGSEFKDTLSGRGGNDILFGNGGNDRLLGGLGADKLRGDEGVDTLDGGGQTDTATYGSATGAVTVDLARAGVYQTIGANQGRDLLISIENLIGSRFDDTLLGSDGANRIEGGSGEDTINGRGGDDVLIGANGDDTIDGAANNDSIDGGLGNDTLAGGVGDDTIVFGTAGSITLKLAMTSAQNTGAGVDTISGFENVTTGAGNDTVTGDAGDNTLKGGYGDDRLYGGDGNDTLYGNQDSDRLSGGNGDDVLYGGLGRDYLTGGAGADRFVFQEIAASVPGAQRDQILDFVAGVDEIDLSAIDANSLTASHDAFTFSQLSITNSAGNTFISANVDGVAGADFQIQLSGTIALTAGDFVFT